MAEGSRELIWAPKARRDLIDIWKYFANTASHVIIYQVTESTIEIARILHERQDISAAFAKDTAP